MFLPILKTVVKSYLSSALIQLIYGLRTLMFFVVGVIVSAMLCVLSVFSGIAYLIYQYQSSSCITYDGILIFFSASFIVSLLIFLKLLSKKYWMKNLFIAELKY